MTRAKPEYIRERIRCPFCKVGDIEITTMLDWYSSHRAHAAGRTAMIPQYHPERINVHNKCPYCGKSKNEIKDILEKCKKPMTHSERIEMWKKRGLPLVLRNKSRGKSHN